VTLVPAILATNEEEYKHKLDKITAAPELSHGWMQVDIADNKFVANQTVGPDVISKYLTNLKIEAQLMVAYPGDWIDQLVKINVKRIIIPFEVDIDGLQDKLNQVRGMGLQIGISLNPETPVEKIGPYMSTIDAVLVMSVHPGFGGQEFLPETIERVRALKSWGTEVKIGVDGGVTPENAHQLIMAGADYLVVGSHLLEGDVNENIRRFQQVQI
jgi:ribulose-phosphate 3-epimerase